MAGPTVDAKGVACLVDSPFQMGTQKELHNFIMGCRRDYLDPTRMLEADRDTIDQRVRLEQMLTLLLSETPWFLLCCYMM